MAISTFPSERLVSIKGASGAPHKSHLVRLAFWASARDLALIFLSCESILGSPACVWVLERLSGKQRGLKTHGDIGRRKRKSVTCKMFMFKFS